ncbi:MAG: hypothetical protein R3C15_09360 [Thermoleophilia bacterium]
MSDARFVDPTADAFEPAQPARRPDSLERRRIGLVDGMLNPTADWGQGLLDGVERHLADRFPEASFERVSRPQLMPSPPDVWAQAMADRYEALVIAAGD